MGRDYYNILGVDKSADDNALKKGALAVTFGLVMLTPFQFPAAPCVAKPAPGPSLMMLDDV